jgi:hypothetical protein
VTVEALSQRFTSLLDHLTRVDWHGHDPYDGLNSRLIQRLGLAQRRVPAILLVQLLRRSPLNFRSVLDVPPAENAKAFALGIQAILRYGRAHRESEGTYREKAEALAPRLTRLAIQRQCGVGWGHHADWASRHHFTPKSTPNATSTIFSGDALLRLHDATGETVYLEWSSRAGRFLSSELVAERADVGVFLRYFPDYPFPVHNVSLLGAAFLAGLGNVTGERSLRSLARDLVASTCGRQRTDGTWPYGEGTHLGFVDNFHTAFNLVGLAEYELHTGDRDFHEHLRRGYEFWDRRLIACDGAPRYSPNRRHPYDIHGAAQAIVTYCRLAEHLTDSMRERAFAVLHWTDRHLRRADGLYGYQKHRWGTVKIPYLRWGQAWMLLALAELACVVTPSPERPGAGDSR